MTTPASPGPARAGLRREGAHPSSSLLIVAIDMGYGHLRPAHALAEVAGERVYHADRPPLAMAEDEQRWGQIRRYYEVLSRASQYPLLGGPLRNLLETATEISSLYPERDLSSPNLGTRVLERMIRKGLGTTLLSELRARNAALLTTFYMPAIAVDRLGHDRIFCVVTDSDINRVWAPIDPPNTRITYLVPSQLARRRLRAYGVPAERVQVTGYPLPHGLVGGTKMTLLKANLGARLVRLDPTGVFRSDLRHAIPLFLGQLPATSPARQAPLVTFAVGGAGAQVGMVRQFLPSLVRMLANGQVRLALVAGIRKDVADAFETCVAESGLSGSRNDGVIEVLYADTFEAYLKEFNELLARTDVLWTKPSEMTFYAGLGLPLVFSWPVGMHERNNRHWALENGAGLKQRDPRYAGEWLKDWLKDGTLAGAAWAGFTRLPKFGLYQILEAVGAPVDDSTQHVGQPTSNPSVETTN